MSLPGAMPEDQLHSKLRSLGYSPSNERTETATFWENKDRRVIQVPDSIQGFYSDALIRIVEDALGIKLTSH